MTCAEETAIVEKRASYPKCMEPALFPFVYPDCKHELQCKCFQVQEYLSNPTKVPTCRERMDYTPVCGHIKQIDCYLKRQYDDGVQVLHAYGIFILRFLC